MATPYVPTTTASATRAADVHQVATTGWPTGTFEVSLRYTASSSAAPSASLLLIDSRSNSTIDGFNIFRTNSNTVQMIVNSAAATVCTATTAAVDFSAERKIEGRVTPTTCALYIDDALASTVATATGTNTSHKATANIGSNFSGGFSANGWIRSVCVGRQSACN